MTRRADVSETRVSELVKSVRDTLRTIMDAHDDLASYLDDLADAGIMLPEEQEMADDLAAVVADWDLK
jgi:hypothetical protein